jgi:anthranilate phosphoribosyltransferase
MCRAAGPVADALNLNAGVALAAAQVAANPMEGIAMAQEVRQAVGLGRAM